MDDLDMQINNIKTNEKRDDFLSIEENSNKRKLIQPFPRWMYARLKYKCSITLLSLLEARTSNDNVIRLIKSLNIEILKRNIVDIFHEYQTNYKENYGYELFLHFNVDPEPKNQE